MADYVPKTSASRFVPPGAPGGEWTWDPYPFYVDNAELGVRELGYYAQFPRYYVASAADATGTQNATDKIQMCIDRASAAGGGVVYVPEGTYRLDASLQISADNVWLVGAGNATKLITHHSSANVVTIGDGVTKVQNIGVDNVRLDSAVPRTDGRGVLVDYAGNVVLRNIVMRSMFHGLDIRGASNNIRVEGGYWTEFKPVDGIAVWVQGGNDHYIRDLVVDNTAGLEPMAGVRIQQSEGTWISQSDFIHCKNGMLIDPGGTQFVSYLFVHGVAFDFCSQRGIEINAAEAGSLVQALTFTGSWTSSNMHEGVYMHGHASATFGGVQFIGHRSFLNGRAGIKIDAGNDWVIDGAMISGNSAPARGTATAAYHGIEINGQPTGWSISNSRIGFVGAQGEVSQDRAIAVNGGDYYRIVNNDLRGNVNPSGLYEYAGASTKVVTGNIGT